MFLNLFKFNSAELYFAASCLQTSGPMLFGTTLSLPDTPRRLCPRQTSLARSKLKHCSHVTCTLYSVITMVRPLLTTSAKKHNRRYTADIINEELFINLLVTIHYYSMAKYFVENVCVCVYVCLCVCPIINNAYLSLFY